MLNLKLKSYYVIALFYFSSSLIASLNSSSLNSKNTKYACNLLTVVSPVTDIQKLIFDYSHEPKFTHKSTVGMLWLKVASSGVLVMTFSPDSKYISAAYKITEGEYFNIIRWEISTGENKWGRGITFDKRDGYPKCLKYSPCGKYLAFGNSDLKILNLDALDKEGSNFSEKLKIIYHKGPIGSLDFSPDGKYIVSHSNDSISLSDVNEGNVLNWSCHKHPMLFIKFSFDGKSIISGSKDCINFCDVDNIFKTHKADFTNTFNIEKLGANQMYCSSNDKHIALVCNNMIYILEISSGVYLAPINCDSEIMSLSFSKSGSYLSSASKDSKIKIWDLSSGLCIQTIADINSGWVCSFSSDGKYLASESSSRLGGYSIEIFEDPRLKLLDPIEENQSICSIQ